VSALNSQQRDASYNTPEAFAEAREHWMRMLTQTIVLQISGDAERRNFGDCTIRYDSRTVEAVSDTLDHACQILQGAMPGFVGRVKLDRQRLKGARADADFQAFLGRLTSRRRGKQ
jgi:hypothetical protein